MFAEPIVVTNTSASALTFRTINQDNSGSLRKATTPGDLFDTEFYTGATSMQIRHTPTKENPSVGGSIRHLVRFDRRLTSKVDPLKIANESVQLSIVSPNGNSWDGSVTELVQMLVSFLTAEIDASLSTDATVSSAIMAQLLLGEP
jgi:hypothetical protein